MSLFLYMCWCICHVNTNRSDSAVLCHGWFCCMHPNFPNAVTKPALGFLQRSMVQIVCRNCLIWMKFRLSTTNVDIAWMWNCRRPELAMYSSCFPCCPHKCDWNMFHVHSCLWLRQWYMTEHGAQKGYLEDQKKNQKMYDIRSYSCFWKIDAKQTHESPMHLHETFALQLMFLNTQLVI